MYKLNRFDSITLITEGKTKSIPNDSRNKDYQEYLEWIAQGNTPEPPDPEPTPSDWIGFNTTLLADINWESWLPQGSDLRTAIISAAIASDAGKLQMAYDVAKAIVPPPENEWQAIADQYGISVTF